MRTDLVSVRVEFLSSGGLMSEKIVEWVRWVRSITALTFLWEVLTYNADNAIFA